MRKFNQIGNLVIFTQTFPPEKGGNASRMGDMYRYLSSFGVNVRVVSALETYPFGSFERCFNIMRKEGDVIRLFTYQPGKNASNIGRALYYTVFSLIASIWLIFNRRSVDIVLVTSPPPQVYLIAITAKLLKKGVVVDVRDMFLDVSVGLGFIKRGTLVEKLFRFLESKALNLADAVTTVTPTIRKLLAVTYGVNPSKCHVVPNGVDLGIFQCKGLRRLPRMVYTGHFGHAQDFDTFLEGYSMVDEKSRLPLILAGGGERLQTVLERANELGISEWVKYLGVLPREEVVTLLCSSLLGVAPIKVDESLEYAVPSKIYEYLACGLPFIGVGYGEIEKVARESKAGCVGRTPHEVKECILNVLNSNLRKMALLGKRYAVRRSREASARKLLEILRSVGDCHGEGAH